MKKDFDGVWISKEMIKEYGAENAILTCGYMQDAPNLSNSQKKLAVEMIKKNNIKI